MTYFSRENGYESDYEKIMDESRFKKTDGYGSQHNELAYECDEQIGPHQHLAYEPRTGKTIYHGENCETKHNKPSPFIENTDKMATEQAIFGEYESCNGVTREQTLLMSLLDNANSIEELHILRSKIINDEIEKLKEERVWLVGADDDADSTAEKELVLRIRKR